MAETHVKIGIFWLIFGYMVEHTHMFLQNFSDCKSVTSKKSYGRQKIGHFDPFYARMAGRSLFTLSSKNLARIGGVGCIFNIFTK